MRGHDAAVLVGGAALLSLYLGAGGCGTPYQARGLTGGYSDEELSSGRYRISVTGNYYTTREVLWSHLRRRAQELCAVAGYTAWELESEPAPESPPWRVAVAAVVVCKVSYVGESAAQHDCGRFSSSVHPGGLE